MNRSLVLRALRRCWALPLLVALSVGFGACSEEPVTPPTPVSTMVTGTIESPDGNQLVEAVVEAVDANGTTVIASDTTDDLGSFTLPEKVTASDVSIRVTHPEFPTQIIGASALVRNAGGRTGIRILMSSDDSCCGVVTVIVRDDSTRSPLGNVQVRLRRGSNGGRTGTTNSDGRVVFRNVCDGEFNIRLARDGYAVVERGGIIVGHCDSVTTDPTMRRASTGGGNTGGGDSCCNGIYRIFPVDSNGNALNGVSVRLTRPGTSISRTLTTGDSRGAIFRELCRGTWNVRIARDGYGVVEFSVTVGCNDSNSTDRTMRPTSGGNTGGGGSDDTCCNGILRLLPLDSTGAVLNGVSVRVTRAGTTTVRSATTEGGRAVIFRELCQGTWNVRFARDGYSVVEYSVTISCNDSVSSDRRMSRTGGSNGGGDTCCRGVIRIAPVDSNGNAINGVSVRITRAGTTTTRTLTTEGGRGVIFREVCSGTWNVRLARDGYGVVEYSISAECNDSVSSDRRMNATSNDNCCSGVLRLRVRDSLPASGDGWMSGATVVLSEGNSQVASGTTNADGGWAREGLCRGHTYTATISKDGYVTKTATFTFTECTTKTETIALRRQ